MIIFGLALATLAAARQKRAMTVNEQGGSWVLQEAQVSNQLPQVSDQVPQVSNQVPQVSMQVPQMSMQVPQVSNQVRQVSNQLSSHKREPAGPVETCENNNSDPDNQNAIWWEYGSQEKCNLSQLMRQLVVKQFNQFVEKVGDEDGKLALNWSRLQEQWNKLSTLDFDDREFGNESYAKHKDHTGCGVVKFKIHSRANYYEREISLSCGLVCNHLYDIKEPEDFAPILSELAGVFVNDAHSTGDAINADAASRSKCAEYQTMAWRAMAAFEDKLGVTIKGLPEPRKNWLTPGQYNQGW